MSTGRKDGCGVKRRLHPKPAERHEPDGADGTVLDKPVRSGVRDVYAGCSGGVDEIHRVRALINGKQGKTQERGTIDFEPLALPEDVKEEVEAVFEQDVRHGDRMPAFS